ncbi:endonuclease III domain-containing protein [Candidatus Similichlamydia epinepheli]|uniref:endonuclease III domain-containing protein n=1 Tax=Candidatus Similichlamydia epinepheli TaxID=1903953 RepID=UPI000D34372E|nr:endonuclease III [Candidatus Similichlamydia epinepheli]
MSSSSAKNRFDILFQLLDKFSPDPSPTLDASSSYTFLIAVLLSARCFDDRVNKVTKVLFEWADSPGKMIKLEVDEIRAIIRPCGLSLRKAESIWNLSDLLLRYYSGHVPSNRTDLESLPGVGRKTASVVLSQWFGQPAFPVDTHVFRCAKRWNLAKSKSRNGVEMELCHLIPKYLWARVHLQMISVGRQFCRSRMHIKEDCPFCSVLS